MKNREEIQEAILNFLSSKGRIPGESEEERLKCEYLNVGVLDSFGMVEMVLELERRFGIRFSPRHMQSDEFRSIAGLIGLVEQLVARKDSGSLK